MAICQPTTFLIRDNLPEEVTKCQYFPVTVILQGCTCAEREINMDLLYEDLNAVPTRGQQVLDGRPQWSSHDTAVFTVRINELSHAHRGNRFIIRFTHHHLVVDTPPMKVLSKSSIVKAHQQGKTGVMKRKLSDGMSEADDSGEGSRNIRALTDEVAELRAACWRQSELAEQLTHSVTTHTSTLRKELADLTSAVGAVRSLVEMLLPQASLGLMDTAGTLQGLPFPEDEMNTDAACAPWNSIA